jgi:predicted aspartyl protease
VLPLWIAAPEADKGAMVTALVDTGSDCTLVPLKTVKALRLPQVGSPWIEGAFGLRHPASLHAARVEFGSSRLIAEVVAFGREAILGRDLLNRTIARLDGPALELSFARGSARARVR